MAAVDKKLGFLGILFFAFAAAIAYPGKILFYNQFIVFSTFCVLMMAAAAFDVRKFIIPNAIVVAIALFFFASRYFLPGPTAWLSHLGVVLTVFLAGMVVFEFRLLGAGDVKLIAVAALWTGFEFLPQLLLFTAICGGVVALGLIFMRRLLWGAAVKFEKIRQSLPSAFISGAPVPYGVSIAVGSILAVAQLPDFRFLF